MLKQVKYSVLAAVGMLISVPCLVSCSANETKPIAAAGPATTSAAAPATASPADLSIEDPAFNRYVNLVMLGSAWDTLDASLMTDCALQLAEGERVLKRNHKAINSNQVLALAAKVAADKNDTAALDRLADVCEKTKNTAVAEQVAAAKKLGGKSRKVTDPAYVISAAETTPTQLAIFQEAISGAKSAGLVGDSTYFKELETGLNDKTSMLASLTESQQKHLRQIMGETLEIMPKQSDKPLIEMLAKLKDASRSSPFVPQDPYDDGAGSTYIFSPQQIFGSGPGDPGTGVGPFIVRDPRAPRLGGGQGGMPVFGGGGTVFGQGGGRPFGQGGGHGHGGGPGTFGTGSNSPYYPRQNSWDTRPYQSQGYPPMNGGQTRHHWSW